MTEITYMSPEGYERLKKEVEQLKTVERPSISRQIAEAREKGDLSENAEYDAAKEAQGMLEMKISKLNDLLSNSRILDKTKVDISKVGVLSKVTLMNQKINKEVVYTIVSENEANFKEGKISTTSPIGKALMGKKIGNVVEVSVPAGVISFEVINIEI